MPKFSVIIPVRNINNYLKENIEYLKKLSYSDYEVIIVTDMFEDYDFSDPRFIQIDSGSKGPGEKRNMGAKISKGDILAFLDDDAYPAADWLLQAEKIFDNPQVYALGGPAVTPLNAGFLEKMSGQVLNSFIASGSTRFRNTPLSERKIDDYPTVNFFVRKTAFLKVGGFPNDFWPGEDTKFCLDLVKIYKRKFLYNPLPVVFHHRRNLFGPFLKQISRYGMHRGQFARIFPENSRIPLYFAPSLFTAYLLFGPLLCILFPVLWNLYLTVLIIYIAFVISDALRLAYRAKSLLGVFFITVGIFLTHIVYGIYFMIGLLKRPVLKLRSTDSKGNYIGG